VSILAAAAERLHSGDFIRVAPDTLRWLSNDLALLRDETNAQTNAEEMAHGSYRHPNGFEKILLAELPKGIKLLIHVWTTETLANASAAEHIHNHRWPFATLILAGSYRFETYQVDEEAGADFLYRYASPGASDTFTLSLSGRAKLTDQISFDLLTDAICTSDSATVHRVIPVALPLVTLFLQGPPDRKATTVVSPTAVEAPDAHPIERLDLQQWRECIETHLPSSRLPTT
jgi:hypothetical protein